MNYRQWIGRAALVAAGLFACPALPAARAADLLDPEDAFKFSAAVRDDGRSIEAHFSIADGYYLYRERFGFAASDEVRLGAPQYPPGKIKFDETFRRELEVYRGNVIVNLPVQSGNGEFALTAKLQGCADQGVCYPPEARTARLSVAPKGTLPPGSAQTSAPSPSAGPANQTRIEAALQSRSLPTIVPIFLVLGLLLSFTPCVLPMLPILSSIIIGQSVPRHDGTQGLTRAHGFLLALAYAMGMAIVYTTLGVAAGLAGEGLAAALQQPWMLISFGILLGALALSMFGFYELQLPSSWQTRLAEASGRMSAGRLGGVFAMGALSALIVGPCVTAPLAGALLYISQTRDVLIGGGALFAMAAGMSVPLLLVGAGARELLPRAGRWMESIKRLFGVLLIGVALWIIAPVLAVQVQMLAWAALFIVSAAYLRVLDALPDQAGSWQRLWKGIGLLLLVLGAVQIVGAASGGRDVLRPLERIASSRPGADEPGSLIWSRVESVDQLDSAIAGARGRPVLLDFYADWCVSCREMERYTYTDARVTARLAGFSLLRADVTSNSDQSRELLKRFRLFGPPGAILFDDQGREAPVRVVGFESANTLLTSLARADGRQPVNAARARAGGA